MISPTTSHALEAIAQRQQDLRAAFTPGARSERGDSTRPAESTFTLDNLSACAPADAYFIGVDERGRQTYSRDGVFHFKAGVLVDRNDRPVLGVGSNATLEPIRIDPLDCALGRADALHIGTDGSLSYPRTSIDPRTGEREDRHVVVGRLALARFSAATRLQPLDATRSLAPANVKPHTGTAGDGNFGPIEPHRVESSRIDIDAGILRLREAYLSFDALRAAHAAQGKTEKTAMDLVK